MLRTTSDAGLRRALGLALRELRRERGVSELEVWKATGLGVRTLRGLEAGVRELQFVEALCLADVYGTTLAGIEERARGVVEGWRREKPGKRPCHSKPIAPALPFE